MGRVLHGWRERSAARRGETEYGRAGTAGKAGKAKAFWDELGAEEDVPLPAGKPLTISAYDAGPGRATYVYYVGAGDVLPEVPLFIRPEVYVNAPLEASYAAAWRSFPKPLKGLVEGGG